MEISGVTETPLLTTPTIPAGDYWFMAVFDAYTSVGISYDDGPQAAYTDHNFNLPLPATFPAPTIYTGQAFNYYLVGETVLCTTFVAPDLDRDCDVDEADVAAFIVCASRAGVPVAPACQSNDFDGDGDGDLADFGILQRCYAGPNAVPNLNCMN